MTGSSWTGRAGGASCAAELRMVDVSQRDVPRGEAIAHLGEGGADHRLLLGDGGGAEAVLGGEGLRGRRRRGEAGARRAASTRTARGAACRRPPTSIFGAPSRPGCAGGGRGTG